MSYVAEQERLQCRIPANVGKQNTREKKRADLEGNTCKSRSTAATCMSWSLVSCRQSTCGRSDARSSARGSGRRSRARSPFTFQLTSRSAGEDPAGTGGARGVGSRAMALRALAFWGLTSPWCSRSVVFPRLELVTGALRVTLTDAGAAGDRGSEATGTLSKGPTRDCADASRSTRSAFRPDTGSPASRKRSWSKATVSPWEYAGPWSHRAELQRFQGFRAPSGPAKGWPVRINAAIAVTR